MSKRDSFFTDISLVSSRLTDKLYMKSLIWNLVKKIFQSEITAESQTYCLSESKIFSQKQMDQDRRATVMNYPIGTKVILRSNEPNDLVVGTVIEHFDIAPHREILLVVKDERKGKEVSSLNNKPHHWSQSKEDALNKLNWAEQWNSMMNGHYVIHDEMKGRREQAFRDDHPEQLTKNV